VEANVDAPMSFNRFWLMYPYPALSLDELRARYG